MSLFSNDPSACGVNNSVNKFTSHANLDHSLNSQFNHNSQFQNQQRGLNNYNTATQIDQSLQNNFENFSNNNVINFQYNNQHQTQFSPQLNQQQQHQIQELQQHQQNHAWISDFNKMSINEDQSSSGLISRNNWSSEFNTTSYEQVPQIRHQNQSHNPQQQYQNQHQYNVNVATLSLQNRGLIDTSLNTSISSDFYNDSNVQHSTFHQQSSQQSTDFNKAFDDIEHELLKNESDDREMNDEELETNKTPTQSDLPDKLDFAKIAQDVFNTMTNTPTSISSTTSTKFKNSNFLKLMGRISKREVEINDDKTKFIDSNGNDVRDLLPDPLKDIKDGEFSSIGSYDSSKMVNDRLGNEDLKRSDWEEVF